MPKVRIEELERNQFKPKRQNNNQKGYKYFDDDNFKPYGRDKKKRFGNNKSK